MQTDYVFIFACQKCLVCGGFQQAVQDAQTEGTAGPSAVRQPPCPECEEAL